MMVRGDKYPKYLAPTKAIIRIVDRDDIFLLPIHKSDKERERINFPNYTSQLQAIFARYKSRKILK